MAAEISIVNPDGLGKPLGQYSQLTRVKGAAEYVFIAGQLATDRAGGVVGADDFDAQCAQVFANIGAALASVGGGWKNVVAVHHLPRALAGRAEVHDLPQARVPAHVRGRRVSAQHAA